MGALSIMYQCSYAIAFFTNMGSSLVDDALYCFISGIAASILFGILFESVIGVLCVFSRYF